MDIFPVFNVTLKFYILPYMYKMHNTRTLRIVVLLYHLTSLLIEIGNGLIFIIHFYYDIYLSITLVTVLLQGRFVTNYVWQPVI